MLTQIIEEIAQTLAQYGIEESNLEAEYIVSSVLNKKRMEIYQDVNKLISAKDVHRMKKMVTKRLRGEPLSYIIGKAEFMGLEFKVSPSVFIPRPETEILVEEVLKKILPKPNLLQANNKCQGNLQIIDLGCGSGAIAISLAKFIPTLSSIYAIDISSSALRVAKFNAKIHGVEKRIVFLKGNLFEPLSNFSLKEKIDFIISNPPYIKRGEIPNLPAEVQFEPVIALNGGEDGLSFYKKIIPAATPYLKKQGFLFLEIGIYQEREVRKIIEKTPNMELEEIVPDYAQIPRVVIIRKN